MNIKIFDALENLLLNKKFVDKVDSKTKIHNIIDVFNSKQEILMWYCENSEGNIIGLWAFNVFGKLMPYEELSILKIKYKFDKIFFLCWNNNVAEITTYLSSLNISFSAKQCVSKVTVFTVLF